MGRMGSEKVCMLIIIKRGWQCKVGRGRFAPGQYKDPSRFELFCLYQNAYKEKHKTFRQFI